MADQHATAQHERTGVVSHAALAVGERLCVFCVEPVQRERRAATYLVKSLELRLMGEMCAAAAQEVIEMKTNVMN